LKPKFNESLKENAGKRFFQGTLDDAIETAHR
jgi:hypothetical protein